MNFAIFRRIKFIKNKILIWLRQFLQWMKKPHTLELLDFSDEILKEIFKNFIDIDLLNATQVCRRFEYVAKETFSTRYLDAAEKSYEIKLYSGDSKEDQKFYREFLEVFGNQMLSIEFTAECRSNKFKILKLISKHCRSTSDLTIYNNGYSFNLTQMIQSMQNLNYLDLNKLKCTNFHWADVHFPCLEYLYMGEVNCIDVEILKRFLYINPGVKHIIIDHCRKFPLKVIQALRGKLKQINSLEYCAKDNEFSNECRDINFEQLDALRITVNASSFLTILSAIARGSKMIRSLSVMWMGDHSDDTDDTDDTDNQLYEIARLFDKLTLLRLNNFILPVKVIRTLVTFLPNVETLHLDNVRLDQLTPEDILFLFRRSEHLNDLWFDSNDRCSEIEKFNSDFHHKFVDVIGNRECDVKIELIQPGTKLIVTRGKIIRNDQMIYWTEFDVPNNHSKLKFVDLNDECFEKICTYLNEKSVRALYETCTRTNSAIQGQIKEQIFIISDVKSAEDILNRFGEHIKKLSIDMNTNDRNSMAEVWTLISEKCSKNITELSLNNVRVDAMDLLQLEFPNLTSLNIASIDSSNIYIFPPMECPKLSQLVFEISEITLPVNVSQFGISLSHLTNIRLHYFSDSIGQILYALDDTCCDQIQEFTVSPMETSMLQSKRLVNIATRFRNLKTLNLFITDIEKANPKYLFQTCIQLLKLSIRYWSYIDDWRKMLRNIYENCKCLEVLQLECIEFDYNHLKEIADTLPNVKLNTIMFDSNYNIYKVESFKRITKKDRKKPF